jgi:hypothetical protein
MDFRVFSSPLVRLYYCKFVVNIFEETAVTIHTIVRGNCKPVCTDKRSFRCVSLFTFVIMHNFMIFVCQTVNPRTSVMEMPICNLYSDTGYPNVFYIHAFHSA